MHSTRPWFRNFECIYLIRSHLSLTSALHNLGVPKTAYRQTNTEVCFLTLSFC